MKYFPGIRNMFSSCCRVNCRGTIVEFLMGVAIRNHLFTSRYHIKSWKVFKDWLLNKKGLQQGMTGIAFEIHPATLSSTQYNF